MDGKIKEIVECLAIPGRASHVCSFAMFSLSRSIVFCLRYSAVGYRVKFLDCCAHWSRWFTLETSPPWHARIFYSVSIYLFFLQIEQCPGEMGSLGQAVPAVSEHFSRISL